MPCHHCAFKNVVRRTDTDGNGWGTLYDATLTSFRTASLCSNKRIYRQYEMYGDGFEAAYTKAIAALRRVQWDTPDAARRAVTDILDNWGTQPVRH